KTCFTPIARRSNFTGTIAGSGTDDLAGARLATMLGYNLVVIIEVVPDAAVSGEHRQPRRSAMAFTCSFGKTQGKVAAGGEQTPTVTACSLQSRRRTMLKRNRTGFTLIELLVVIAI